LTAAAEGAAEFRTSAGSNGTVGTEGGFTPNAAKTCDRRLATGFVTDARPAVGCGWVTRALVATALARRLGATPAADVRLDPVLVAGLLFVEPVALPDDESAWLLDGPDPEDPPVSAEAIPAPLANAAPTPSVTAPAPSHIYGSRRRCLFADAFDVCLPDMSPPTTRRPAASLRKKHLYASERQFLSSQSILRLLIWAPQFAETACGAHGNGDQYWRSR
jgi:hypothetical protein